MIDFDNLSFWNTLNKTHQVILVWNRNKKIVYMKKYVYEERKKTTHGEIGEMITTSYIWDK